MEGRLWHLSSYQFLVMNGDDYSHATELTNYVDILMDPILTINDSRSLEMLDVDCTNGGA